MKNFFFFYEENKILLKSNETLNELFDMKHYLEIMKLSYQLLSLLTMDNLLIDLETKKNNIIFWSSFLILLVFFIHYIFNKYIIKKYKKRLKFARLALALVPIEISIKNGRYINYLKDTSNNINLSSLLI